MFFVLRVQNSKGKDIVKPLKTSFYAPPAPPKVFSTSLTTVNSEMAVHWTSEIFGGQMVDFVRIQTNKFDGNCNISEGSYCKVAVSYSEYIKVSYSGIFIIGNLMPGKGGFYFKLRTLIFSEKLKVR